MRLPNDARDVLLDTEQKLVGLAHLASQMRDYGRATDLLEAARRVKAVADDGIIEPKPATDAVITNPPIEPPKPREPSSPRRVRKADYPRFLRDGEALVKVGWSKAEKSEYEHKSPKKVLQALGESLKKVGAKGRRFAMDKVLPLNDPEDSTQLPDYQTYLCLAWLRHSGLVVQHGRQGYSLPKDGDLAAAIELQWERLPIR